LSCDARPRLAALLLALSLDVLVGEPPERLHPVVWMGRGLAWLERLAPASPPGRLAYGLVVACGHPAAWALVGWLVERRCPWPVRAVALKPTFAGRALLRAAARVEAALRAASLARSTSPVESRADLGGGRAEATRPGEALHDLAEPLVEARRALAALVSRPTAELGPGLVAAAAIESVAENLVDSWVAPLTAYAWFGLPGAYAYRAANTADAMWGYRTPRYEHLGKAAARLDDLLTFGPARLGALLLILAGPRPGHSLAVWRRDAGRTPSPNAGQPMSAAAGQLGVRLEKRCAYVLNAPAPEPGFADITAARGLVARAMLLGACLALTASGVRDGAAGPPHRPGRAWQVPVPSRG
jgi:adenosylcobinamide-phosphate synthase